jgi:hypothetical protein
MRGVLALLLIGCHAPAPCVSDTDCPTQCLNGSCAPAGPETTVDADLDATLDATPDAQRDAMPDQARADRGDAQPDGAVDQALDMQVADHAMLDAAPDMAPPCEGEFELRIDTVPRAPLRRGEVFEFDVTVPEGVQIEASAPYGAFQRQANRFEWAPRGGMLGDLPAPWWSGGVELTVTGSMDGCIIEQRVDVPMAGDVLLADQVTGTLWVLGSGGRLLERWVDVPGGGISALTYMPRTRELLVGVRAPNERGHHLIHRLDADGQIVDTLATEDFATGAALLPGPAIGIAALPNNRIIAASENGQLPVWQMDGNFEALLPVDGPVETLRRWDAAAVFSADGQVFTTQGAGLSRPVTRNRTQVNALFAHQDPLKLIAITGPSWTVPLQLSMGQYSNLLPLEPNTDIRALTRFGDGHLSYDSVNRRIRQHDDQLRVVGGPAFGPDIRIISVGALLWLDRPPLAAD